MVMERLGFEKVLEKMWRPFANIYTILVVMFAWVLFRSDTLAYALQYWKAMFNFKGFNEQTAMFLSYMNTELYIAFAIAILGSFGFFTFIRKNIEKYFISENIGARLFSYSYHVCSMIFYAATLIVCTSYLIAGTYNPFIYYRF
jgi:alginate O-acetyltransferase complex protein AlgI